MSDDQLFAQYQRARRERDALLRSPPWSGAPEDTESTEGRMVASAHAALASACRRPVGIVAEAIARLGDDQRARLAAALRAAL